MGGSKPPPPTPPKETSQAQTGANISTAIANNFMSNANLIGADGSTQRTEQTGVYNFTDPYTGQSYDIPTFTRTESLSPVRQQTLNQSNQANLNLATLGANTSRDLIGNMQKQLTAADLGARPTLPTLQSGLNQAGLPGLQGSINTAGLPGLRGSYDTEFTADRQRTEDALFSRLSPKLQQDRAALETQLSNQGIKLGSSGYDRAMGNFGQQSNDARMAAILASGQEQSRLADLARQSAGFTNNARQQGFAENMQSAGFGNAARQQGFQENLQAANFGNAAQLDQYNAGLSGRAQQMQEAFALDNQPVNKAMALASGTQVANPQFQAFNVNRIPTTDNAGIIQNYDQAQMQRWQAEEQGRQNLFGGLMGMGGKIGAALPWATMFASDERLKENIEKVGKLDGHSLYRYNYKGHDKEHIGVMAQEVEKKRPDAVHKTAGGVRMVDYGALFNAGKKGAR